jgi:hypothetical protein
LLLNKAKLQNRNSKNRRTSAPWRKTGEDKTIFKTFFMRNTKIARIAGAACIALALGIFAFAAPAPAPAGGCENKPGSNNGRCVTSTSGGQTTYFCGDAAWYQSKDCVKKVAVAEVPAEL